MAMLLVDADQAIELLFRRYYAYTVKNVLRIIPDTGVAEDLGQEVFFELWKKRERIQIKTAVKAYLRRSATNKALNYLRDNKVVFTEEEKAPQQISKHISAQQNLEAAELEEIIQMAIDNLPDRCRVAFNLSRFEHKSYQEIADLMGVSIKTVENQIGKALKILRATISPFVSKGLVWWVILSFGF